MSTSGNAGLDALADAIAERVIARLQAGDKRLMPVKDAAAYLGMSQHALRHKIAEGSVPVVREGGRLFLDRADLDHWIELRKA